MKQEKYYPHDDQVKLDPMGEVAECVMFNTPSFMCYDYDKISRDDRALRIFNLEKQEREKIIGKREDWERAIRQTFFTDPNSPELWEAGEEHPEA